MKRTTTRKKTPPKYVHIDYHGYAKGVASVAAGIECATTILNNPNNSRDHVGIYRLVKVCRRTFAPIEIEDIPVPCSEK